MSPAKRYSCKSCAREFIKDFFAGVEDDNRICLFCTNFHILEKKLSQRDLELRNLSEENKKLREQINHFTRKYCSPRSVINSKRYLPPTPSPPTPPAVSPRPPPVDSMTHYPPLSPTTSRPSPRYVTNIATQNRFSVLEVIDIEDEINSEQQEENETNSLIIGDSLLRGLGKHLANNKNSNNNNKGTRPSNTVMVYPGANLKLINKKINENQIPQGKSTLVVNVGSNDIFHKHAASEEVIQEYEQLIDTIKDRADNAIIVGSLPRMKVGAFSLSRAIGINERIRNLCKNAKIGFVDPWSTFIANGKLYQKDGIHLNSGGCKLLASLIKLGITTQMKGGNFQ